MQRHTAGTVGAVLFQFSRTPQLIKVGADIASDNEKTLNFQAILCELRSKISEFSRDGTLLLLKIGDNPKISFINEL